MGRLLNVYRLGIKKLRSLWSDKILFVVIFWVFTGGSYVVAMAASQELHNAPIAVVDEDSSTLSARLAQAFYGPYFQVPRIISLTEMDPGLDAGRYIFVLDIPPDFEKAALAGKRPDIQVNIDAACMAQAILYRGATFSMVWPRFVAIACIGFVFFFCALTLFRRSLAQSR